MRPESTKISAVWTAEAQISRVVTINRDTGALKENAVGRLDCGRKHRLVRGRNAHRADNVIGLVRRPDSAAGSNRWIVIGGNGDLVPGSAHGPAFNVVITSGNETGRFGTARTVRRDHALLLRSDY